MNLNPLSPLTGTPLDECSAKHAEIARLRDALDTVESMCDEHSTDIQRVARAALEQLPAAVKGPQL